MKWETLTVATGPDVRRLRISGGWLYQVQLYEDITNASSEHPNHQRHGWHPPVFVPFTAVDNDPGATS